MGAEGEVLNTPFHHIPIQDWPWDYCVVLNYRRSQDSLAREISFHPDFPPPSKRTQRSQQGIRDWRRWLEITESTKRARAESGTTSPKSPWEEGRISAGRRIVFDYKTVGYLAWEHMKTGEVCGLEELKMRRR